MSQDNLFTEFSPQTTAEWKEKITTDLKGKSYDKLIWKSPLGVNIQPFYRGEDLKNLSIPLDTIPGQYPYLRSTKAADGDWKIRQDINCSGAGAANKIALEALQNNVQALGFYFRNGSENTPGIEAASGADLDTLLKDILLDLIDIHLLGEELSPSILAALLGSSSIKTLVDAGKNFSGSLGYDPLRTLLVTGSIPGESFKIAAELAGYLSEKQPEFRGITVFSKTVHEAGASSIDELAYTLAAGSEYLYRLTEAGMEAGAAASQIHFSFEIGPNYFFEIAKLRAARLLWSQIATGFGASADAAAMKITAVSSGFSYSIYDTHNNMLRGTTEAMSGALGGADTVSVLPYDFRLKATDSFGARIARNAQHLLKHESYFDRVLDPAAGSYYIETLTDTIAKEAWAKFQSIEADGGYLKLIESGKLQADLKAEKDKRLSDVAIRKEILLGTNQYPNPKDAIKSEQPAAFTAPPEVAAGSFAELLAAGDKIVSRKGDGDEKITAEPVTKFFLGDEFEDLRAKVAAGSKTPKVLPIMYGHLATRNARSIFMLNFFNTAGFEVLPVQTFDNDEDKNSILETMKSDSPDIVALCSSDDEYAEFAEKLWPELTRANGKVLGTIGGKLKDEEALGRLSKAGEFSFIHARSNFLEELTGLWQKVVS